MNLSWSTASEQNSAHFIIERSSDGRTYTEMSRVSASGNTNTTTNYIFTDKHPIIGTAYYRLRQVDVDGKVGYSKIAISSINEKTVTTIIYPNPVNEFLNILINSPQKQQVRYRITDVTGRLVNQGMYQLNAGDNNFQIATGSISPGRYTLTIENAGDNRAVTFVKQ